jgi:hypothetical protein
VSVGAPGARDPLVAPVPYHLDPCAFRNGPRERPVTVRDGLPALLADATGALRAPRTGYDGAGAVRSRWSSSRAITLGPGSARGVRRVRGAVCGRGGPRLPGHGAAARA